MNSGVFPERIYKDYAQMPDEPGYRLEILDGFLVKEPSPSVHHQRILRELARQLMAFFDEFDPPWGAVFRPLGCHAD